MVKEVPPTGLPTGPSGGIVGSRRFVNASCGMSVPSPPHRQAKAGGTSAKGASIAGTDAVFAGLPRSRSHSTTFGEAFVHRCSITRVYPPFSPESNTPSKLGPGSFGTPIENSKVRYFPSGDHRI